MVNGGVEISDHQILDAMRDHRFGAVIEVTNGITRPQKRQWKKRQVRHARGLLEKALGDSAQIASGLALIKNTENDIKELDVLIQISEYDTPILYKAAEEVLRVGTYLDKTCSNLLSQAMDFSNRTGRGNLAHYLTRSEKQRKSRIIRPGRSYLDNIAKVKGAVLELYVRHLFNRVLTDSPVYSLGTEIYDRNVRPDKIARTDLLLATSFTDFTDGLNKLDQKYTGRKKIKVTYPSEALHET